MRSFNNNNKFGGPRNGGGNRFGGRDSGRSFSPRGGATMHDAVCAECGKNCQVPFEPSGSKPVYCSDCFQNMGGGNNNSRPPQQRSYDRPNFSENRRPSFSGGSSGRVQENDSQQLNVINTKLDKILEVLKQIHIEAVETPEVIEPVVSKAKPKKTKAKKAKK